MADEADEADGGNVAGANDTGLAQWVSWLDDYMAALPAVPGEKAIDFCEAAGDLLHHQTLTPERHPTPDTAGALLVMDVARSFTQVSLNAALDERITRETAQASLLSALEAVRIGVESWHDSELPSADLIAARKEALKSTFEQAQGAAADRIAEDEADDAYAVAHPYGAILGYQDPTVEADIIFTQVCEFTEDENTRYGDAYDRLKQLVDQDLFSYVSDECDRFIDVVCEVLREIQDQTFSLSNSVESHLRIRRIRSALIGFTSSLQIHQDQTYYKVKHKFGKGSAEHLAVKALLNGIYSGCFGYRWLFELRHVMLHVNMDAFTIRLTAKLHGAAEIELAMSRHWMSKSSGIMDKPYKRDELESMDADPSVLDMVKEMQPEFGVLQDAIDEIMFPATEVAQDAATVRELIGRFGGRRGMYALQTGPGFTRRFHTPSYSQLDTRVLAFADGYEITP